MDLYAEEYIDFLNHLMLQAFIHNVDREIDDEVTTVDAMAILE